MSHGHDAWLPGLLRQLAHSGGGVVRQVIVTHNLPPVGAALGAHEWPFELVEVVNPTPAGFGTNHNRAFERARADVFCVLNPDLRFHDAALWQRLSVASRQPGVGCAYPRLRNPDGQVQDSEREAVTPWALVRRRVFGQRDRSVEWVSAALWAAPSAVYRAVGGFDERYFMYCEDVDFCLRVQLAGYRLCRVDAEAEHEAQRASHRRPRHFFWHLQGLWRLWTTPVLWRYLRSRPPRPARD
ncbi:glycosyltransferase [Xylophilus ampelinus]|uniref:glycosyltransferase n=1 Tax=Xylophilus ampelinus TaxID=54067 RepID=UPI001F3C09C6|nr:glycosyltransferase [Xylophilus ampelinus]MCS4510988.1 glycosyltransferase [Xylophilus ampelinus]